MFARDFQAIKTMAMGIKKQQQLVKRSKNIKKSPISAGVCGVFGDDVALMEQKKIYEYNEPLESMWRDDGEEEEEKV